MESCFRIFGQVYLVLGANTTSYFWLNFLGNSAKIRIFRVLEWLSSISGAKIVAQNLILNQNKKVT